MTATLEQIRERWTCAQKFPQLKEEVYPQHAKAHGFDEQLGKVVLEYGCGNGSDVMSLLRRGANHVTFCDIVPGNVEVTRERVAREGFLGRTQGLPLDQSAKIPQPTGMFDAVTSHGVIHHIEEPIPVLQEFWRLLKTGGTLFVMFYTPELEKRCEPSMAKTIAEQGWTREQAFCYATDGHPTYARSYSKAQAAELLSAANFQVVSSVVYNNGDFETFRARKVRA